MQEEIMSNRFISKLKHQYLISQVKRERLPNFRDSVTVRKKILFYGKVQNVGFRFQVSLLSEKMGLRGRIKNTDSGAVELVIQGSEEEIFYLVNFMQTRKRLEITKMEETYLPLDETVSGFSIV